MPYGAQVDEEDAQVALSSSRRTGPSRERQARTDATAGEASGALREILGDGGQLRDFVRGNIKARERMMIQYAIAGELGYLVVGTDHAAEALTGFFTKFGDGGADLTPLTGLTKRQAPRSCRRWARRTRLAEGAHRRPGGRPAVAAGRWALGVTYQQIDDFLEGRDVADDVALELERMYLNTRHKRTVPVTPLDTWWRED
ncbi:NAD(+) synthase [Rhodococcus hoagii]|nr:NAD(+) synthase [Prescottella equi]